MALYIFLHFATSALGVSFQLNLPLKFGRPKETSAWKNSSKAELMHVEICAIPYKKIVQVENRGKDTLWRKIQLAIFIPYEFTASKF